MEEYTKITYLPLPNGDKLVSWYRHDYKTIELPEGYFMIDGGQEDYIKYSSPDSNIKPITESLDDCFYWVRDNFSCMINDGSRVKLKDINDDILEASQYRKPSYINNLYKKEIEYRIRTSRDSKIKKLLDNE